MKQKSNAIAILLALSLFPSHTISAAPKGKTVVPEVVLTDAGKAVESQYAAKLQAIQQEIQAALPKPDAAKTALWLEAIKAEEVTAKDAADKAGAVVKMQRTMDALKPLEESAKQAPKTYAEAKDELIQNKALGIEDPQKDKLLESEESYLAYLKIERDQLGSRIEKAMAAAKDAAAKLPEATKAAAAAKLAHEKSRATLWQAMDALGMDGILGSDKLDGKLALYTVIKDATPLGLAQFSEKSPENAKLVQQLLSNEALMIQMLMADGPNSGKYGGAMKIYTDIQKASPKAKDGLFQRLALAVSLGHALPIQKRASVGGDSKEGDEPAAGSDNTASIIDPVKRYLSYEKWYLDGELDPCFKDLSVWNLAMAVDASDPDEILAWGRTMLHSFRPDCIPADGNTSIYVDVVDKEIAYTSAMVKNDRAELAFMQNILSNGGVCGRRAYFGRFALQAFGVPTSARKEPGHATLAHWHPDGWQTKLGGKWGAGPRGFYGAMNSSRSTSYDTDVNFLASSQAREDETAFIKVKRAQWIGALLGERSKPGLITWSGKTRGPAPLKKGEIVKPIFWNELALNEQKRIIAKLESGKNQSSYTAPVVATSPAATGKITVDEKGVITIPSAATSHPTSSIRKGSRSGLKDVIVFIKNKAGETHLHLSRYAVETDSFHYTFDAPKAGKYKLAAALVTSSPSQILFTSVNGAAEIEWALPFTMGMWDKVAPIVIELKAGSNVLKFRGPGRLTLGDLTLTPMN